jgi:hypothetical protein
MEIALRSTVYLASLPDAGQLSMALAAIARLSTPGLGTLG